jgi:hypothetical protein
MIKKIYKEFEQVILFFSVITYLISFMFYFDDEMRNTSWMSILWLIQFFGLGTLLGLYGRKKGWRWPKRY